MKRIAITVVATWTIASCAATDSTLTEDPVTESTDSTSEGTGQSDGPIWSSTDHVTAFCGDMMAHAAGLREALKRPVPERTVGNTLLGFNEMMKSLDSASSWASFLFNVHPTEEVRTAAQKCRQAASKFMTEVNMDRGLYDAIAAVDVTEVDALTRRF